MCSDHFADDDDFDPSSFAYVKSNSEILNKKQIKLKEDAVPNTDRTTCRHNRLRMVQSQSERGSGGMLRILIS